MTRSLAAAAREPRQRVGALEMALTQAEAIRLLVANRAGLYTYLRSLVADGHLAEDALQQLSVVLLKRHDQIPDAKTFLPWARHAARLEARSLIRQRHPHRLTFGDDLYDVIDRYWDRYDGSASSDILLALERCVDRLPEKSRQLLYWRFTDGLECGDIAARVGQSVGAVYVSLSRMYDRLEGCIQERLAAGGES